MNPHVAFISTEMHLHGLMHYDCCGVMTSDQMFIWTCSNLLLKQYGELYQVVCNNNNHITHSTRQLRTGCDPELGDALKESTGMSALL